MEILDIRTSKRFAGPGVDALNAEMKIWDEKTNGYLFLHYSWFDAPIFTVADHSIYDYLVDGRADEEPEEVPEGESEFMEEYVGIVSAMKSEYVEGFILLYNLVENMSDITYGHRESVYSYIVSDITFESNYDDDDREDDDDLVIRGTFQYKTKAMPAPVKRTVVVTSDCCLDNYSFELLDENGNRLEYFDDLEAAAGSKWVFLYTKLKEDFDNIGCDPEGYGEYC